MVKLTVIRETIKSKPWLTTKCLDEEVFQSVGEIAVKSIKRNIRDQKQADGSQLKKNEPSTIRRKELLGTGIRSLIDIGKRFFRPHAWSIHATNKNVTIEPSNQELKDIVYEVQARPVGQGGGYLGWFGIDAKATRAIRIIMRNAIRKFMADKDKEAEDKSE